MSMIRLLHVLSAPSVRTEVPPCVDWSRVEDELGTRLPSDYKQFIECFGTGCFNDLIWIFTPFTESKYINLLRSPASQAMRKSRAAVDDIPWPIFPEKGGVLPCGGTDTGHYIMWLTEGEPDAWPIIVMEGRSDDHDVFHCDLTDLLAGLLSRSLQCRIFDPSWFEIPPDFKGPSSRTR